MSLSRRQVRLREYLYRRSLEGREKEVSKKKRKSPRPRGGQAHPHGIAGRGGGTTKVGRTDPSRGPLNRAPGALDDEYARS